jgi:hypothetical protein
MGRRPASEQSLDFGVTLAQAFAILRRASAATGARDFVVIGSCSSLGMAEHAKIPERMAISTDLDCYTKDDPGRIFEMRQLLGEGSPFHRKMGVFLDPVSPFVATLPDGWEGRLIKVERDGVRGWFLDPNDAAISKYARSEPRDIEWIRAGLASGLISVARLRHLLAHTSFVDAAEERRAAKQLDEDERWLRSRRK